MSQVIYEVNLTVERVIADEFAGWLHPHIQAMVNLRGFMEAQWFEVTSTSNTVEWCVQYRLESQEAYEHYITNEAPKMRGDGLQRFGDRFEATRRLLVTKERFER